MAGAETQQLYFRSVADRASIPILISNRPGATGIDLSVETMLALAESRDEVRVVADQLGSPTYAPDIAVAIIRIARNVLRNPSDSYLRGTFHLAGGGETSWAGLASAIFAFLAAKGLRSPVLTPIGSADYPTPARRPANSRLNCAKLAGVHGIELPSWRDSLGICLERLTS